jgi:hypothetical protein
LSDEIDELRNLPVRDADEEVFELKEICSQLQTDLKLVRTERDALKQDIEHQQMAIQKHDFDLRKQIETVACLNDEVRCHF